MMVFHPLDKRHFSITLDCFYDSILFSRNQRVNPWIPSASCLAKRYSTAWYNLQADLPRPVPPPFASWDQATPVTGRLGADFLEGIDRAGSELGAVDRDPRAGAPRAEDMASRAAGSGHRIGKGIEDPGPHLFQGRKPQSAGSHKPNTAVGPGLLQQEGKGINRLTTETGAGQWGCALSFACALFGLECKIFHGSR